MTYRAFQFLAKLCRREPRITYMPGNMQQTMLLVARAIDEMQRPPRLKRSAVAEAAEAVSRRKPRSL